MDVSFDPRVTASSPNRIFQDTNLLDALIALVSRVAHAVFEAISWVVSASIAACSQIFGGASSSAATAQETSSHPLDQNIQAVLNRVPEFAEYKIGQGTDYPNTKLMNVTVRPSNLFFDALLGRFLTTTPDSNQLFAFRKPHRLIRETILRQDPNDLVSITAITHSGYIIPNAPTTEMNYLCNLADLYGSASFSLSYGEIQSVLQSQKIYVAPLLPLGFYKDLKQALRNDEIVTLPGDACVQIKLNDLESPYCKNLIANVRRYYPAYKFASEEECKAVLDLTLYQVGALVVKSEDFYLFLDANGKIRERNPGENDAIRLISVCGIKGLQCIRSSVSTDRSIINQMFLTAFQAAESGFLVVPAVGMGQERGDPELYWRAFFDAVITAGTPIEKIFVNPAHQPTHTGRYAGCSGQEFQTILKEYIEELASRNDTAGLANLAKIVNLYTRKTDLVHLSQALKVAFPDKTVSLINASDPDVTLGNHVGGDVNNLKQASTTEENYTAMGSHGLCFETITGVHEDPSRVIQAYL